MKKHGNLVEIQVITEAETGSTGWLAKKNFINQPRISYFSSSWQVLSKRGEEKEKEQTYQW